MGKEKKPLVGISIGDINGIGVEVILKALEDKRINDLCTLVVYGSSKVIQHYRKLLKINEFKINVIKTPTEAKRNNTNLIECWDEEINITPGKPGPQGGKYAFLSLKKLMDDLKEGSLDAIVTAPIDKSTIQSDNFSFPGHTEFLAAEDDNATPLMLLLSNDFRIAVASGHIPISQVANYLTTDIIAEKIELLNKSLIKDFGITRPKIAVLGLNPHAGDNGLIGDEEEKIIGPAIRQVKTKEIFAFGPFPADGFFGSGNYKNFNGVLAMYHDQGLIPIKTLSFDESVNFTAGLSFVRTSPDHGTAYAIAGKNMASPQSFRNAIYAACDIVKKRSQSATKQEPVAADADKKDVTSEIS